MPRGNSNGVQSVGLSCSPHLARRGGFLKVWGLRVVSPFRMAPPGGERLSYFALAAFQRWPIARGSSFPRRLSGSTRFRVACLFLWRFKRAGEILATFYGSAGVAGAFLCAGVSADILNLGTVSGMTSGVDKERLKLLFFILRKPALKLEYRRTKKNKLFSFMAFLSFTYCPLYTCA